MSYKDFDQSLQYLDCCQPTICGWINPDSTYPIPVVKETKEQDMYANHATATIAVAPVAEDKALKHVLSRLYEIMYTHRHTVSEKYADLRPKNAKEAKEWLHSGNWRIEMPKWIKEEYDSEDEDECGYYVMDHFYWGKTSNDEKRTAAFEAIQKAYQDAVDTVNVVTDETTRLKALKDFEAYVVQ